MDIQQRLQQANGRLRTAKVGVSIRLKNNRLYLRTTLPPKPGSPRTHPYQQEIALGIHANLNGIKLVEAEARKVGALLDCKEFTWEPYIRLDKAEESDRQPHIKTVAEWVAEFESDYFSIRARTPKTETTWKGDYLKVLKHLPHDQDLSPVLLKETILSTQADTKTRKRYCMVLGHLARYAGIAFDPSPLSGNYSPTKVNPREIPNDAAIAHWFSHITNPAWRWAYGMLATYGLRNHEVFNLDLESYEEDKKGALVVLDGKTGYRLVWPYYREWVQEFDLKNVLLPSVTGNTNSDYGHRVTEYFYDSSVPFKPYSLRHAYAIRTIHFGLPIAMAARIMGHSCEVHTQTYHRWLDQKDYQRVYEATLSNLKTPLPPRPEENK